MFQYHYLPKIESAKCIICGRSSSLISIALGIRSGLTPEPPRDDTGVRCRLCTNECSIPEGGMGYCGLRKNINGKLVHLAGTPEKGIVQCYYDPLPTNCVAIEFCAGGSGAGYPRYAHSKGAEYGF